MPDIIYKISSEALWREAERAGAFTGAPVDLADGFIHFSTAAQVAETAARHFAGATDLCWWRSTPRRSAPRCATNPRAAARCSRISTARCRSPRALGEAAAAWNERTCVPGARAVIPCSIASRRRCCACSIPNGRTRWRCRRSSSRRCRAGAG
jgi:hypothetical protein